MSYTKPELEIKEYNLVQDSIITTSEPIIDPDLNGGDGYDPFGG